ncbi:hypothetical protein P7C70_g1473, partial [Phenoliferia sp. Uapishka_3]
MPRHTGDVGVGGSGSASQSPAAEAGSPESKSRTSKKAQRPSWSELDALRQSVAAIRQRCYHLEAVLAKFVPQLGQTGPDGAPMYAYSVQGEAGEFMKEEAEVNHSFGPEVASGSRDRAAFTSIDRIREEGQIAESDGEVEGRDRQQDHTNRSTLRRTAEDEAQSTPPTLLTPGWPVASSSLFPPSPGLSLEPSRTLTSFSGLHPQGEILPDREQSDLIVRYSLERVGWQHGAVHGGSFKAECEEFFSWGERRGVMVNHCWLALYYAVLCVGTKHMSSQDRTDCGLISGNRERPTQGKIPNRIFADDAVGLPKAFFDASVDALHRGNFMGKHSIYSLQAIVILVMTCQDVGGSDLIATLLACGIRIAQHLNIHRFPSDADWEDRRRQQGVDPYSPDGIKALIDREVRKRLWCALTTEDWVGIPYRRSYAIFPSHFSTPLPTNSHDEDLANGSLIIRPLEEPTHVSKLIISIKVASCVRRFFEDVNSLGGLSYDLCLQIDREIREIIRTCPSYLSPDANIRHLPSFVGSFRNYWIMSVHHKLLIIHRAFLGKSFRDPRYAYSRKAAIEAARVIIQRFLMGSHLPQHVWTAIYHAISASTILILDVFQSSTSDLSDDIINKRLEVTSALDELERLSPSSPIAARGAQLLGTLLAEEQKHRRPGGTDGHESNGDRKRKMGDNDPGGRFGDAAKRIVSSVGSSSRPRANSDNHPGLRASYSHFHPHSHSHSRSRSPSTLFPHYPPHVSPGASDGSLTQESLDSILWNGLGAQIGADPEANSLDFWRMLDASFEPAMDQQWQ